MQIDRITLDPAVMGGKPCIRGMRVTVGTIFGLLASSHARQRVLETYPYLEPEGRAAAARRPGRGRGGVTDRSR